MADPDLRARPSPLWASLPRILSPPTLTTLVCISAFTGLVLDTTRKVRMTPMIAIFGAASTYALHYVWCEAKVKQMWANADRTLGNMGVCDDCRAQAIGNVPGFLELIENLREHGEIEFELVDS